MKRWGEAGPRRPCRLSNAYSRKQFDHLAGIQTKIGNSENFLAHWLFKEGVMSAICERRFGFGVNRLIFSIVVILLSAAHLGAQMGTATLSGMVSDPSGSAIPAAQVTLSSSTEKVSRPTVTDTAGQYVIPAITPGTYELVVRASGFQPQTLTGIILASGQGSTLNVSMKISAAQQEMTVNEAPPLLETTTATLGSVVNSSQFTELPLLGRNFTSLVYILPGVNPVPGADASYAGSGISNLAVVPSVYGQRQRDNDFTLDGGSNVTPNFSRLGMIPPPEAVAE